MSVTTCTNHCSQCGRHFHSLAAFDTHHQRDDTGWPVCLDPVDLVDRDGRERLVALTEHGECRMYADAQRDVTIWTTAQSAEKIAQWRGNAVETREQAERPPQTRKATR
jgi:hypothetical protein